MPPASRSSGGNGAPFDLARVELSLRPTIILAQPLRLQTQHSKEIAHEVPYICR
jgi:hypothetical protein